MLEGRLPPRAPVVRALAGSLTTRGRGRTLLSPGVEGAHPRGRGSIDPQVDIGHVHLKVADVDRSLAFYCDVLGFELRRGWATRQPSSPPAGTTTTSA